MCFKTEGCMASKERESAPGHQVLCCADGSRCFGCVDGDRCCVVLMADVKQLYADSFPCRTAAEHGRLCLCCSLRVDRHMRM